MPFLSEADLVTKAGAWLDGGKLSPADRAAGELLAPAVRAYVTSLPIVADGDDPVSIPKATAGAVMLLGRLIRRRMTPAGITQVGDMTSYIRTNDPDVSLLLELGPAAKPKVG